MSSPTLAYLEDAARRGAYGNVVKPGDCGCEACKQRPPEFQNSRHWSIP